MSVIIRKSLLELIFSGAFMKRWNDKLRPMELVEVDKQGHKMIVAWLLFLLNSRDMDVVRKRALGEAIIEGGLYDYFYRLVITDIKPPVFYRIKENPDDYRTLSNWVLNSLKPRISPLGEDFMKRMEDYLNQPEDAGLARRILKAAHLYASYSEFKLLKSINTMDHELVEIEESFVDRLEAMRDLVGVSELLDDNNNVFGRFARMCGRLRFQQRWSQTPRVPETSVLGHMFIVASYSWFFSMEVGACRARRQNNFFSGLFHDLPELLTRDIISPVKGASLEIGELIHEYEIRELDRVVLALRAELERRPQRLLPVAFDGTNVVFGRDAVARIDRAALGPATVRREDVERQEKARPWDAPGFLLRWVSPTMQDMSFVTTP